MAIMTATIHTELIVSNKQENRNGNKKKMKEHIKYVVDRLRKLSSLHAVH